MIERFEREIAFHRVLVAVAVNGRGTFQLPDDLDERAECWRRLVDEHVVAGRRADLTRRLPEHGRQQFVCLVAFQRGMKEGDHQIVARVIEEEEVFKSGQRPGDALTRRNRVATDLKHVRVVHREDSQTRLPRGMR